jgi:hypothetical protein
MARATVVSTIFMTRDVWVPKDPTMDEFRILKYAKFSGV